MFKHILVPTDGSPLSQQTVLAAVSFAKEVGARITFFCAAQANPAIYFGVGAAVFDEQAPGRLREMAREAAQKIVEDAQRQAEAAGMESEVFTLFSDTPYEGIIEAARQKGCDLIIMASHGRRGVDALLLGSETQKVLTHSRIPVLVHR